MSDNRDLAALTGNAACDEVTYSGDTAVVQLVGLVDVAGSEGARTVSRYRQAATATLANVSGAISSTTLLASNTARKAAIIYNDGEAVCYVKYGSTASSSSFTHKLGPYEFVREDQYTGIITGIWSSATGAARVTELTA